MSELVGIIIQGGILLVTTAGVGYAIHQYRDSKRSFKEDAANIILLEIQRAKRQKQVVVQQIQQAGENELEMLRDDVFLMPVNNWDKYKYLFVQDLDRDAWDDLSSFYERCNLFDEAVRYNNSSFQKNEEQVRNNSVRLLSAHVDDFVRGHYKEHGVPPNDLSAAWAQVQLGEAVKKVILNYPDSVAYSPKKPILDARKQLELLGMLDLGPAIKMLKVFARIQE